MSEKFAINYVFTLWNENPHKDIDYYYFMRYDNKLVGYNLLSRKIYLWKFYAI